ncbi:HAD-IA family hydrolase [Desulforhopalus sp. 52FAK]
MRLGRDARCVIFDMDGVLLNTEPMYDRATNKIASRFDRQLTWEVKAQTLGRDYWEGANIIVDGLGLPISAKQFFDERAEILNDWYPDTEPVKGAPEFTRFLGEKGIPMGVATSSPFNHFNMKTSKKHTEWFNTFRTIVTGDDPQVKKLKPAPDIFLAAAERMEAAPEDCVVFEDAPAGVEAALAAGMQVIALPDKEMDRNMVKSATLIINSYSEIQQMDIW